MKKIVVIYDVKALAHYDPMFVPTIEAALRLFAEAANDKSTAVGRFPEDFTLFEIGEWDEHSGDMVVYEARIPHGNAIKFVRGDYDDGR